MIIIVVFYGIKKFYKQQDYYTKTKVGFNVSNVSSEFKNVTLEEIKKDLLINKLVINN
ncbi:hypothetical protein [Clostridium butyricum]|jgi:hypothetical protein|uniref:hypothetical protein n=1 Tax=Clostridium butyricum TaxID=1492 RepID=UPI00039FD8F4|nr:hypothetical protein [Clostridium butyricum]